MLCEQCKVKRAEIHLVNVINGERHVQHLCRECAEAHLHLDDVSNLMKMSFSVEGLLNIEEAFKDLVLPALRGVYANKKDKRLCPHCGGVLPDSMFEEPAGEQDSQETDAGPEASARVMSAEEGSRAFQRWMRPLNRKIEYAAQLRDRMAELKKSNMTQGGEL
ncbi:MAG: hypothetical protein ACLUEQ_06700 [Cloacibacillus evryensis]